MDASDRRRVYPRFTLISLAGRSIRAWLSHDAASMGAALSFYTLFSIAPILVVATWLAGSALEKDAVRQHVLAQMQALMGDAGAAAVGALLAGSAHVAGARGPSYSCGLVGTYPTPIVKKRDVLLARL